MPARRDFLRYGLAATLTAAGVATPLSLKLTSNGIILGSADALARNGGGGGGGNGGGSGGGNGGSGAGNGNGGGKGGGRGGQGNGKGNADKGLPSGRPDMAVQHRNGIREGISQGRYTMRDSRGRVIVSRPATPLDYLRVLRRP